MASTISKRGKIAAQFNWIEKLNVFNKFSMKFDLKFWKYFCFIGRRGNSSPADGSTANSPPRAERSDPCESLYFLQQEIASIDNVPFNPGSSFPRRRFATWGWATAWGEVLTTGEGLSGSEEDYKEEKKRIFKTSRETEKYSNSHVSIIENKRLSRSRFLILPHLVCLSSYSKTAKP